MKYPIGIQSFEKLRSGGYAYVDKTRFVYELSQQGCCYFLSRPRRFGKSLFLSTLRAFFEGRRDLFEGLAIAGMETEWHSYPVLHLDFNIIEYNKGTSLDERLNEVLCRWEEEYHIKRIAQAAGDRFENIIIAAHKQHGKQVVVLVDEYDKPLLANIEEGEAHDKTRNKLKAFCSALKSADEHIRFALLTGVTRFSKVSVFSDLNNLRDISMVPRFADICGITEQELRHVFDEGVQELADENGTEKEACFGELRRMYDGYHFSEKSAGVYNPFSVLNTLVNKKFDSYWFATGTPTFLAHILQNADIDIQDEFAAPISGSTLASIDSYKRNPVPIIFQSGYLTIKDYDPEFKLYTMGFPNEEVRVGFLGYLLPYYVQTSDKPDEFAGKFVRDVRRGNPEGFMQKMQDLFAKKSYVLTSQKTRERDFQNAIWLIFELMGFYVEAEQTTARGRIDITVQTRDYVYIIELKQDHTAAEALAQIRTHGYADRFRGDTRRLFCIGVGFSQDSKEITGYEIEEHND